MSLAFATILKVTSSTLYLTKPFTVRKFNMHPYYLVEFIDRMDHEVNNDVGLLVQQLLSLASTERSLNRDEYAEALGQASKDLLAARQDYKEALSDARNILNKLGKHATKPI